MSEEPKGKKARFYSSGAQPGRATPLDRREYEAAVAALFTTVEPVMAKEAAKLHAHGFSSARVESTGAMVSLIAVSERAAIKGTLRFQIHETFAVLVERDPVFWMFTLFNGSDMLFSRPGRLPGLEDTAAIEKIVEDFGVACELGLKSRAEKIGAYFTDVITWALDGELLRAPDPAEERVHFTTCARKVYLAWAVVPVMTAACRCLARRFPAWDVRVLAPAAGDESQCVMSVVTNTGRHRLRFRKEGGTDGETALCYQVAYGRDYLPPEPLEIVTKDGGHFVASESIDSIVGEFVYALVSAWNLSGEDAGGS